MASTPPDSIDDTSMLDDMPASETDTLSPPADQSAVSTPGTPPALTPDPASTEPVTDAGDPAPAPTGPFGPKSVRGGNMSMRVLSRAMQDLEIVTGGKRAATYDEVDEYVGRAIATEQALERAAIAGRAESQPGPTEITPATNIISGPDAHNVNPARAGIMPRQAKGGDMADATDTEGGDTGQTVAIEGDDLRDNQPVKENYDQDQEGDDGRLVGNGSATQPGEDIDPAASMPQVKPAILFRMTDNGAGSAPSGDPIRSLNPALDAKPAFSDISKIKSAPKPKQVAPGTQTVRNGIKYQDWGGDMDAAQHIMEHYPALMKKFARSDIIIAVVPDNVAEYPIANSGNVPSGWPAGTTYKDVPALFYDDHIVILAAKKVVGQSPKYRMLHEMGHALDYMSTSLGGVKSSSQAQFKAAYAADLASLKKIDKIHYFDDNTARGRSEIYADSFSRMKVDRALLRKQLPNIYAYWAKRGW